MTRKSVFFIISLFALLSLNLCAYGQVGTDDVGAVPNRYYSGGEVDHVQVQNGSLYVKIPLVSYPEPGKLAMSFSLTVNGRMWEPVSYCDWQGSCSYYYSGNTLFNNYGYNPCTYPSVGLLTGIRMEQSLAYCYTNEIYSAGIAPLNNYTLGWNVFYVLDSTGAKHELGYDTSTNVALHANDGSGMTLRMPYSDIPQNAGKPPESAATIVEASGVSHLLPPLGGANTGWVISPSSNVMELISDPAGNVIRHTVNSSFTAAQFEDPAGRTIPDPNFLSYASGSYALGPTTNCPNLNIPGEPAIGSLTWQVPGLGGSSSTYTLCYTSISLQTDFFGGTGIYVGTSCDNAAIVCETYSESVGTEIVLQSLVLPNNTYWGFVWDTVSSNNPISYGDLKQIIYPTGGSVSYSYANIAACSPSSFWWAKSRSITQRREAPYVEAPDTITTSYTATNSQSVVETDSTGNDIVHGFSALGSGACDLLETSTKWYSGSHASGALLKEIDTGYQSAVDLLASPYNGKTRTNQLPYQVTTIMNGVTTDVEQMSYDTEFTSGIAYEDLYAEASSGTYSSYGLSGSTPIKYGQPSATISNGIRQQVVQRYANSHPAFVTNNMLQYPGTVSTYDGSNNLLAQMTYSYDSAANNTSVSKWLNTGGSVTTSTAYNSMGMPTTQWDANGGLPGEIFTRGNATNWYGRSLEWREGRSTGRSRSYSSYGRLR